MAVRLADVARAAGVSVPTASQVMNGTGRVADETRKRVLDVAKELEFKKKEKFAIKAGFFEGQAHSLSTDNYLMRYDVEVSGFPSQHAGHLCLLRLKDDDYTYPQETSFEFSFGPEKGVFQGRLTELVGQWPSWDLPILKWGKEQGGVVGFSHSGWGLQMPNDDLPSYEMPAFDGIGANEYIVDVVHGVCDFISAVDTPITWEMNIFVTRS